MASKNDEYWYKSYPISQRFAPRKTLTCVYVCGSRGRERIARPGFITVKISLTKLCTNWAFALVTVHTTACNNPVFPLLVEYKPLEGRISMRTTGFVCLPLCWGSSAENENMSRLLKYRTFWSHIILWRFFRKQHGITVLGYKHYILTM